MAERRRISVKVTGELARARLNDKKIIDAMNVCEMGDELCAILDDTAMKAIVLDFEGVEFLSSAALNQLLRLNMKARQSNATLRLCNLRPEILEVFRITRFDKLFDIRGSSLDEDDEDDDDDNLESWGAWVPNPTPPDNLDGRADRGTA